MTRHEQALLSAASITTFKLNGQFLTLAEELARPAGLTAAWWQVLGAVLSGPLPVAGIAREMGMARQSVQRVADILVERDLAEYRDNPAHRRAKLLMPTEEGRAAVGRINPAHAAAAKRLAKVFGEPALADAVAALRALSAALDESFPGSSVRSGGVGRAETGSAQGRKLTSVTDTRWRRDPVVTAIPDIMLNNGQSIPQFGFGVFLVKPEDTAAAVSTALQAGYRHIDTAEMYGNEREVGEAIAKSGLDRADVFVTSKLSNDAHQPDDARRAFDESLKTLGFDYLDLFLIHWPLPTRYDGDYVSTWRTLEEFYREGRARSIGVSNFQPRHLRRLHAECDIPPAVDQIEVNPYLTQDEVRGFCAEHQIAIEAWSPLGRGNVLTDPMIDSIARRTGKTPAQVVLRWHIERGDIIFPKSVTPDRIRENIDIFDFELPGADVEAISVLNRNERTGPDPDKFDGR